VNLLTSLANQSQKFLTIENLIQELFQLKRKKNEDEALINMLKVQIRKLERPEGKEEKKSGKISFFKSQEMYLFNQRRKLEGNIKNFVFRMMGKEKLMEENLNLKKKIIELSESHKFEKMKLNKLNNEISKKNYPLKLKQEKNYDKKNKEKEEFEAKKATLRNEYRELEEKCEKLKEKVKEKEEKVIFFFNFCLKFWF